MRLPKFPRSLDLFFFFLLLYLAVAQILEWSEPLSQKYVGAYVLMTFAVVAFGGKAFR